MSTKTYQNNGPTDVGADLELSQPIKPEQVSGTLGKLRKGVQDNTAAALLMLSVVAGSMPVIGNVFSPNEAQASTGEMTPGKAQDSEKYLTLDQIRNFLHKKQMPDKFTETVLDLSARANALQIKGEGQGTELVYNVGETLIHTDEQMLRALVNDGTLLPKQYFYSITGQNILTPDNYGQVVAKLFDTSDTGVWLRKWNGAVYSPEEKTAYDKEMAGQKTKFADRQLGTIAKIAGPDKVQEATERGFTLFNTYKGLLRFESRESYRRLFTIIFGSIVPSEYQTNPKIQHNTSLALSSQLTELYILVKKAEQTNPNGIDGPETITKMVMGPSRQEALTYQTLSQSQFDYLQKYLAKNGAELKINYAQYMTEVTTLMSERFTTNEGLVVAKEKGKALDEESRQAREESRQAREESRQARESNNIIDESSKLVDGIVDGLKQYINMPSGPDKTNLLKKIKADISNFNNLKEKAQQTNDNGVTSIIDKSAKLISLWGNKANI